MAEHNHIILQDSAIECRFVGVGGGKLQIPVRDEQNYADMLSAQYSAARWKIGIKNRNQGCVISDYLEMTGQQMASCDLVAVYPSTGWYKTRKGKVNSQVKYSLVVSLETPEQDIYTEIAQKVGVLTELSIK